MRGVVLALALVAAIGPAHAETPGTQQGDAARSAPGTSAPATVGTPTQSKEETVAAPVAPATPATSEPAAASSASTTAAAPVPATPPPAPAPIVIARVDLTTQRMTVSVNGTIRHTWAISSGRADYPTPRGRFRAQWMSRMWYSRKYDLAPMPYSVFFHGGAAIHGTSYVGSLGRPASHGCVRLANANAATFYGLVKKYGLAATQVIVTGTPPPSRRDDLVASRDYRPPLRMAPPRPGGYTRYVYDGYSVRPMPFRSSYGYAGRPLVFPGDFSVRTR